MAEVAGNTSKPQVPLKAEQPVTPANSEITVDDKAEVQKPDESDATLALDLIVGDTVQYVVPRGPSKGSIRPALVTHLVDETHADLHVFFSPTRDGEMYNTGLSHVENVPYDPTGERGTFKTL